MSIRRQSYIMNTKSHILRQAGALLLFLSFFFLVYSPVSRGHYFYGEDYHYIWTSDWPGINEQSYTSYTRLLPVEGRPLHTLYYYLVFNNYINSLKSAEAANTVRLMGIIGVGLLAYVLYLIFRESRFKAGHAFFLSVLICLLPPFHTYVGRVICVAFIFSMLLSALSSLLLFRMVFDENRGKTADIAIAAPISAILFITALCIYQPTATTYWAMAVIPLSMLRNEDVLKKWRPYAVYAATGFASMLIYYGVIKIYNHALNIELQARGAVSIFYGPVFLCYQLLYFIKYPLYSAINLWNIVHTKEVMIFIISVIAAGIMYGFIRVVLQIRKEKKETGLLFNFLCRYVLILIAIPMSFIASLVTIGHLGNYTYLVSIVTNSDMGSYAQFPAHRTIIGPEIVLLMLFYMGLMNIADLVKSAFNISADLQKKIINTGLLLLTVIAAAHANHNVDKYIAAQHSYEYNM